MALAYRSSSRTAGSGLSLSPSLPSGVVDGDILIACVYAISTNRTIVPPSANGTWTQRATIGDGNLDVFRLYTKRALSEPGSETWTQSGGSTNSNWIVDITAISGGTVDTFFEQALARNDAGSSTAAASDAITAADPTAFWVLYFGQRNLNSRTMTFDSPFTERVDVNPGAGQMRFTLATDDSGATTQNGTGTWSAASTNRKAAIIAIKAPPQEITPPFIASTTQVFAPTLLDVIYTPFIASTTTLFTPTLVDQRIALGFINSTTAVYTPTLVEVGVDVPFIPSETVVYPPTLIDAGAILVPFIPSQTVVYPPLSLFDDGIIGSGTGNGGESFSVLLNGNGDSDTGTLTTNISLGSPTVNLSGDSGLPATKQFVFEVDSEQMLLKKLGTNTYRIIMRGLGNTVKTTHSIGAVGSWGDSYDMAIDSLVNVAQEIEDDGDSYPGWLICFDSSQGYQGSSRYPMHVTNFLGVFPEGGGSNKVDSDQPSAVHITPGISDDCPSGMTVPALTIADISVGDVAVVRYTNPSGSVTELGARSVAVQAWYGMMRVDDTNVDVTFTDPDGNIVDGTAEEAFVDTEYVTTVLDGDDRVFTYGPPKFSDKGWPIAALAVRHGQRRVPYWESETWRDYSYVYSGFHPDATFVQILINRNGLIFGPLPEVALPGPQDIDGPDAYWDDYDDYHSSTSWYVTIFNGAYIYIGPGLNIPPPDIPPPEIIPIVLPPTNGNPPVIVPPEVIIEGGSGGGINPPRGTGGGPLDLSKLRFRGNETAV